MTHQQIYRGYEDVFILPSYSELLTRQDVSTAVKLESPNSNLTLSVDVPIVSANMDTITELLMCTAVRKAGGIGALHRFMSIEQNVGQFKMANHVGAYRGAEECFVSIGTNDNCKERAAALHAAGARFFIVDIAHGHSLMMKNTISWLRQAYGRDVFIVAGNVATPQAIVDLEDWGADAIKVGVGPGKVCLTKDVTGVTVPIFSAVQKCASVANVPIIADGGCRSYGDVAKAIGAGASLVMSGLFFAGTNEVPARAQLTDGFLYRGMASRGAMEANRGVVEGLPTAEGTDMVVAPKGSAVKVVEEIAGGLRSAYSYVGAKDTTEFQSKVQFGYRR